MKLSLSFLKEYIDIDLPVEELASKLTISGTKVEGFEKTKDDTIIEFEITPNRGDCFSVLGIAREISALTGKSLKEISNQLPYLENQAPTDNLSLILKNPELCPHYALAVFNNVTTGKSPDYIRDRLEKAGIRPLNNIIDVTNYVMLETGMPSHAFDFDLLNGHKMTLRASKKGEKVTTLDGVARELPAGGIIIEDKEKLIDLAGLMGGQNSAINPKTKKVALLVPIYNPINTRRTSLTMNLRTEASGRFEKPLDPLAIKDTFYRIAKLFFETSGAKISSEVKIAHTEPVELKIIEITLGEIEDHLGITLMGEDLVNYLTPLGFLVKHLPQEESDRFAVTVPSWRADVLIKVDVIEEIARLYGYNNFPKTLPLGQLPTHPDSFTPDWERITKEKLVGLGLTEVMGYTLLPETSIHKLSLEASKTLKILNPNSEDFVYLRPTLLIGLLTNVGRNLFNFKDVSIFEIGKVFSPSEKQLPNQDRKLSLITTSDFSSLKGWIESLFNQLNIAIEFKQKDIAHFASGKSGLVSSGKENIGKVGNLDAKLLAAFNIETPLCYASFDFEMIAELAKTDKTYSPLPKYPEVKEDLSLVVEESVTTEELQKFILQSGKPLLKVVEPFDQFVSPKLGINKKSLTFSLTYAANKTLTNEEVAKVRTVINKNLTVKFKADIR